MSDGPGGAYRSQKPERYRRRIVDAQIARYLRPFSTTGRRASSWCLRATSRANVENVLSVIFKLLPVDEVERAACALQTDGGILLRGAARSRDLQFNHLGMHLLLTWRLFAIGHNYSIIPP